MSLFGRIIVILVEVNIARLIVGRGAPRLFSSLVDRLE